jgi:farnesyl diphosphate synthase
MSVKMNAEAAVQKITARLPGKLSKTLSISEDPKLLSKDEISDFMHLFPDLLKELVEMPEMRDMPETNRWMEKMMQYNVPHGKRNRGLATALAYKYFSDDALNQEDLELSYVLGWCTEILQAFFLVADDIMDGSETRRGRPCWYKVDNLGPAAFNDAVLLEASIYALLKKYFRAKPYYVDVLDIMHDITYKTIFGQSLDTRTGLQRQIETYTMDRYSGIVKYKTSFYSFTLPVALAMAMAGITDPELKRQVQQVTLEMGHFFQVQDDFLDCFGDEQVTGKIGTDIQDCKCSWLCVTALQKANSQQRELIMENYGQDVPEKIAAIKELYKEMNLPQVFADYEEQTYNLISSHIQQMNPRLPKQLFLDMLQKIYRRSS